MNILAIVITRSQEYSCVTVESLKRQTLKPEIHVEIGYPIPKMSVCKLVLYYFNKVLKEYDLSSFDYILKSDEDVIYPRNFLEENTKLGYDVMGSNACMLLKADTFMNVMNGRLILSDYDGLLCMIYSMKRLKVFGAYPKVKPVIARKEYRTPQRFFLTGRAMYSVAHVRLRYFFFRTFRNPFSVFSLLGYLISGLKRNQRYYIEAI